MFMCGRKVERKPDDILSFTYSYNTMVNFDYSYRVVRKGKDKAKVIIHEDTPEEHSIVTDTTIFSYLQDYIDKYKMYKYNTKSFTPIFEVMDGTSWGVNVEYGDETKSFHFRGSNDWPGSTHQAFREIMDYLESLFEKK